MGWIVAGIVLVVSAWAVAIFYNMARPARPDSNQPYAPAGTAIEGQAAQPEDAQPEDAQPEDAQRDAEPLPPDDTGPQDTGSARA